MDIMTTRAFFFSLFSLFALGYDGPRRCRSCFEALCWFLLLDPPPPTRAYDGVPTHAFRNPKQTSPPCFKNHPKFPLNTYFPVTPVSCRYISQLLAILGYWLFSNCFIRQPHPAALSVAFLSLSFSCAKISSYTLFCLGFVCLPAVSVFLGYFG